IANFDAHRDRGRAADTVARARVPLAELGRSLSAGAPNRDHPARQDLPESIDRYVHLLARPDLANLELVDRSFDPQVVRVVEGEGAQDDVWTRRLCHSSPDLLLDSPAAPSAPGAPLPGPFTRSPVRRAGALAVREHGDATPWSETNQARAGI